MIYHDDVINVRSDENEKEEEEEDKADVDDGEMGFIRRRPRISGSLELLGAWELLLLLRLEFDGVVKEAVFLVVAAIAGEDDKP